MKELSRNGDGEKKKKKKTRLCLEPHSHNSSTDPPQLPRAQGFLSPGESSPFCKRPLYDFFLGFFGAGATRRCCDDVGVVFSSFRWGTKK